MNQHRHELTRKFGMDIMGDCELKQRDESLASHQQEARCLLLLMMSQAAWGELSST